MKAGIDPPDNNYKRIPKEDRPNTISWGTHGYIVELPFGNQQAKDYPDTVGHVVELQDVNSPQIEVVGSTVTGFFTYYQNKAR